MVKSFDPTPFRSKVGASKIAFDRTSYKSKVTRFKEPDQRAEYFKAVYAALGLPYERKPDHVYHFLGHIDLTSSEEAVKAVIQVYLSLGGDRDLYTYLRYLDAYSRRAKIVGQIEAIKRHRQREDERYEEYQYKLSAWHDKDPEKRGQEPHFKDRPEPDAPVEHDIEFVDWFSLEDTTPNLEGYLNYIWYFAPGLATVLSQPVELHLEENPDRPHGYILGTPGSGKSELLKLLVHTYVTNKHYGSVVVIDPTSDFVGQMARWKEFNTTDRLVYFRPTLVKGFTPCINPFEIHDIDADNYSEDALNIKRVIAQELVEALGRIVTEGGGYLTAPMRTILTNCVLVLLDKENSTLEDLSNFMKPEKNSELIAFAQGLSHHEFIADYFATKDSGFNSKGNQQTRDAIGRRMDDLLSVGLFRQVTCGKSTLDLEDAINNKKVILFDLGKGSIGRREGSAFGRLMIAMLIGIAYRREKLPKSLRIPCSVVIDECHSFLSETMEEILMEARKFRLFLTMAQQIAGQRMPINLRDAVLEATNLQIVGGTSMSGAKRNADIVSVEPEKIRQLDVGEFYVRANRSGSPIKFEARSDLIDWRNTVAKSTWKRILADQIHRYYRKMETKVENTKNAENKNEDQFDDTWSIETS